MAWPPQPLLRRFNFLDLCAFVVNIDMPIIYIALGTNLGDRLMNLEAAIGAMQPAVHILAQSPIYQTEPWGHTEQPAFLNQVVRAETDLSPYDLLAYLKGVETTMGRTPTFRYGPRLIDLDILLYGDLVIDTPDLIVPHPHLPERAFVLVPLADLAPGFVHPKLKKTISVLLESIDRSPVHPLPMNRKQE
jgi:2-amino-4-hydroxy-6-hydroxymethyldihydropteridine diphosphokinase